MKRLIVLLGLALSIGQSAAFAAVLSMDLQFSNIDWQDNGTPANATVRLSFDTLHDTNADPNVGSYSATVTLLSGASSGQSIGSSVVTVINNVSGVDTFSMSQASFPSPFVDVDGEHVNSVDFMLTSSKADMFASDALPIDPAFASKADFVLLNLTHEDATQGFSPEAPAVLISISSVPEPSSYVLLAIGLLSLLAARGFHVRQRSMRSPIRASRS